MQQRQITIMNKLGLHARAAARLVRLAANYQCSIVLSRCDARRTRADAKSILTVLLLAATQNTELEIITEGDDEEEAMEALCRLIAGKFGED